MPIKKKEYMKGQIPEDKLDDKREPIKEKEESTYGILT